MKRPPIQFLTNEPDFALDPTGLPDDAGGALPLVFIQSNIVADHQGAPQDLGLGPTAPTAAQFDFLADDGWKFADLQTAIDTAPNSHDRDHSDFVSTWQVSGVSDDSVLLPADQDGGTFSVTGAGSIWISHSQPLSFAPLTTVGAPDVSAFASHTDFDFSAVSATAPIVEPFGFQAAHAPQDVAPSANVAAPAATGSFSAALPGLELANAGSPATEALGPISDLSGVGSGGATAAQVQAALDESGLNVNGSGIKVGVLSDSFNDLGGAAADEADGALPSAANVQVLKDDSSGGTDEGRAMMQIIHDIAPGASLAFYTAEGGDQAFANGILALAAAGCKVIVDDVSYLDEPFFQNGVVAQAIQTVEAEGVTYVTAAGNNASNAYQAAWTPISGSFDGIGLTNAESFGGSIVQTITVGANSNYDVPLMLEWNQAYGAATSDLALLVFSNGTYLGYATNASDGEPTNPWVAVDLSGGATYEIAIENLSGSSPTLIKEITEGDGLPVSISGADVGTVFGHAMTPGAITAGAVSAAATPTFGVNPALSETFSSSGAGTELLFANNGTPLSSPDVISPVAVSGIDDIATTVPGGLSDFYGTSASSASLAGVAALMLSANPNLTPAEVEQIMEQTALPMANSAVSGAGLVQVDPAVQAAEAGLTVAGTNTEAVQGAGTAARLLAGVPTIKDPTATTLADATVKIANGSGAAVTGDELYVNGIQNGSLGSGVTATWNAAAATLTLSGSASLAVYETLLSETAYQDTGTDSSSGSHPVRTVTWDVNDGTNSYSTISQVIIDRVPVAASSAVIGIAGASLTEGAAGGVLSNVTDLDNDALVVAAVSDTAHGTGAVGQSLAGIYGHLTLNSNGSYSYAADIASAIAAGPTGGHLVDTFTYVVSDGNGGTASATLAVTLDRLPVVTATNVELTAGHASVAALSLFTASDPDGGSIVTYGVIDGGPGEFLLNGVGQTDNQEIDVSAAQLSQLVYQSAPGTIDTLQVRVNDGTLWSAWQSFTVAAPALLIQADTTSFGSTDLTEFASQYFLYNTSGVGPVLEVGGTPIMAGGAGAGWEPFGAVETGSGYDVAWKNTIYGLYTVWQTDGNGNYVSDTLGAVSGNNIALENLETTFNQDLNGDGTIGPITSTIQTDTNSFGSISLVEVGNEYYYLYDSGGAGPALQVNGAPVLVGGAGAGWEPFGAVETATGYEIAWKDTTNGLYTVWQTDGNGNYVSDTLGAVSGNNIALENLETTFNQDLNSDATIGPVATVIQTDTNSFGSITLVEAGNEYDLRNSGGTGPILQVNGTPIVDGGAGAGWEPFGAVETATGYDVAWKDPGDGLYTVWQTDNSGNYVSDTLGAVTGNNIALENLETTFNQDLNGDGTIGPVSTVIRTDTNSFGSITLVEAGNEYYLHNSGGTGPAVQVSGTPIVDGGAGAGWEPIGAVETATGYDVAWKNTVNGLYTIWQTDSNGNYVSDTLGAVTGNNVALEQLENTFNQDLNGDGVIGVPPGGSVVAQYDDGAITNVGTVHLDSAILIDDTTSISNEKGSLMLAAATIVGSSMGEMLSDMGTIAGTGTIGDGTGHLALDNGGTIEANGGLLTIDTGATVTNSGVLAAAAGATLQIHDPVIGSGSMTVGVGASAELGAGYSGSVTFESATGTLRLDNAPAFHGEIFNFSGDGTLSGSDQIDLRDINFNTVHDSYADGVLTVGDGSNTATLDFNGSYVLANFSFANDGSGGTIVYDPPVSSSGASASSASRTQLGEPVEHNAPVLTLSEHDTFIFPASLTRSADSDHAAHAQPLNPSEQANVAALLAAIHDDSHATAAADMVQMPHPIADHFHVGDFFVK